MAENIDARSEQELERAISLAQYTVYKKYLNDLSEYPLVEPDAILLDEEPQRCLRVFQLKLLTHKKVKILCKSCPQFIMPVCRLDAAYSL